MMLNLSGHLGDRTAALVDGQLSDVQAERAWRHVLGCPGCREAVEQQAATKRTLGGLRAAAYGDPSWPPAPASWLAPEALAAWEQVGRVEHRVRRRTAIVGGGALTATLAVAVVVGAGAVTAPAVSPAPADIGAGRSSVTPPSAAVPGSWTASWTGTSTGAETSRAVREHRSR